MDMCALYPKQLGMNLSSTVIKAILLITHTVLNAPEGVALFSIEDVMVITLSPRSKPTLVFCHRMERFRIWKRRMLLRFLSLLKQFLMRLDM